MGYTLFVQKAISQDKRNRFEKCTDKLSVVPKCMEQFYLEFNPVDVEVEINEATVRFVPIDQLAAIKEEYPQLKDQFIFATINGDPVFCDDGIIYVCAHGVKQAEWEKLANSFAEYLEMA